MGFMLGFTIEFILVFGLCNLGESASSWRHIRQTSSSELTTPKSNNSRDTSTDTTTLKSESNENGNPIETNLGERYEFERYQSYDYKKSAANSTKYVADNSKQKTEVIKPTTNKTTKNSIPTKKSSKESLEDVEATSSRSEAARSYDLDANKYTSPEFHNKNNVYSVSSSPDIEKYEKFGQNYPSSLNTDETHQEIEDSIKQHLEQIEADREKPSIDDLIHQTKQNDSTVSLQYLKYTNITSDKDEDKNRFQNTVNFHSHESYDYAASTQNKSLELEDNPPKDYKNRISTQEYDGKPDAVVDEQLVSEVRETASNISNKAEQLSVATTSRSIDPVKQDEEDFHYPQSKSNAIHSKRGSTRYVDTVTTTTTSPWKSTTTTPAPQIPKYHEDQTVLENQVDPVETNSSTTLENKYNSSSVDPEEGTIQTASTTESATLPFKLLTNSKEVSNSKDAPLQAGKTSTVVENVSLATSPSPVANSTLTDIPSDEVERDHTNQTSSFIEPSNPLSVPEIRTTSPNSLNETNEINLIVTTASSVSNNTSNGFAFLTSTSTATVRPIGATDIIYTENTTRQDDVQREAGADDDKSLNNSPIQLVTTSPSTTIPTVFPSGWSTDHDSTNSGTSDSPTSTSRTSSAAAVEDTITSTVYSSTSTASSIAWSSQSTFTTTTGNPENASLTDSSDVSAETTSTPTEMNTSVSFKENIDYVTTATVSDATEFFEISKQIGVVENTTSVSTTLVEAETEVISTTGYKESSNSVEFDTTLVESQAGVTEPTTSKEKIDASTEGTNTTNGIVKSSEHATPTAKTNIVAKDEVEDTGDLFVFGDKYNSSIDTDGSDPEGMGVIGSEEENDYLDPSNKIVQLPNITSASEGDKSKGGRYSTSESPIHINRNTNYNPVVVDENVSSLQENEGGTTASIGDESELGQEADDEGDGTVLAITISCIGAVCLIILVALLFVMRKRHKRFNYGQRCTPVSLDAYSVDNVSVYNSVHRKGVARASKRSYGNPAFDDPGCVSHPLNFPALAKFALNQEGIATEYEDIPQVTARTNELPDGCETKNRYANVIPLPETRVYLSTVGDTLNSDYINANFVKGPQNAKCYYIATQAPMQSTVDDFWRMVWEQQTKVILMLTNLFENGSEKSIDYLPPSEVLDCHRLFGDFQVTLKKREVKEKYIISSLQLKNMVSNSWREVTHLWYMGWPEKGVPNEANSLIAFLIEARSYMKATLENGKMTESNNEQVSNGVNDISDVSPIVVHCSPGTGRTGTVIACDIAIREFELTRQVNIPRTVYRTRRDRANSVQTKEQFAFIYKVISLYATKLTGGVLDAL